MSDQAAGGGGIRHAAWVYRTPDEYLAGIRDFVHAGVLAGEPVLVAVPAGRLSAPSDVSGETASARWLDAADLGRNPARLMPAVRAFADEHRGQHTRVISELAWAGRSGPELGEVARYELMANLAFAATPVTMVCPYDGAGLPPSAIRAACTAHPWLWEDGHERHNGEYVAPDGHRSPAPALAVPPGASALSYRSDLRPVRGFVSAEADRAGLSEWRRTDLVIAASEVAANTLKHTGGGGLVRVWLTSDEILCQFDDSGYIADPLAGYGRPAADEPGGQGLWLVNQVCDLAEIRTSAAGTTVRLHMFRDVRRARLPEVERVRQPR